MRKNLTHLAVSLLPILLVGACLMLSPWLMRYTQGDGKWLALGGGLCAGFTPLLIQLLPGRCARLRIQTEHLASGLMLLAFTLLIQRFFPRLFFKSELLLLGCGLFLGRSVSDTAQPRKDSAWWKRAVQNLALIALWTAVSFWLTFSPRSLVNFQTYLHGVPKASAVNFLCAALAFQFLLLTAGLCVPANSHLAREYALPLRLSCVLLAALCLPLLLSYVHSAFLASHLVDSAPRALGWLGRYYRWFFTLRGLGAYCLYGMLGTLLQLVRSTRST